MKLFKESVARRISRMKIGFRSYRVAIKDWWQRQNGRDRLELTFQFAIVVLTIGYLIVAHWQFQVTNDTLIEIKKQNQIAEQSMQYGQAAYMVVQGGNVSIDKQAAAVITFVNGGNTPAYQFEISVNSGFRDGPIPSPMPPLVLPKTAEFSKAIIAPHGTVNSFHTNDRIITPDDLKLITNKTVRFYIWGILTYEDIFKRQRWTTFCLVHRLGTNNFDPCQNNNEAN